MCRSDSRRPGHDGAAVSGSSRVADNVCIQSRTAPVERETAGISETVIVSMVDSPAVWTRTPRTRVGVHSFARTSRLSVSSARERSASFTSTPRHGLLTPSRQLPPQPMSGIDTGFQVSRETRIRWSVTYVCVGTFVMVHSTESLPLVMLEQALLSSKYVRHCSALGDVTSIVMLS